MELANSVWINSGRILMDVERMPTIIPIWLSNFDRIMPEPRSSPRFVPRLLAPRLLSRSIPSYSFFNPSPEYVPTITFGNPFTFSEDTLSRLDHYRQTRPSQSTKTPLGLAGTEGIGFGPLVRDHVPSGMMAHQRDGERVLELRKQLTAELQTALENLGSEARRSPSYPT